MSETKATWRIELIDRISSKWSSSGAHLTLFSMIILPSIVVLSAYYDSYVHALLGEVFFSKVPLQIVVLDYSVVFLQWSVIFIILFIFPPYPFPLSIKNYFKKRGYENAVVEYELVKEILYFAVPIFIVLTVVIPGLGYITKNYELIDLNGLLLQPIYRFAQSYTLLIVFAGALKIVFILLRKDFELYYAKGCFKQIITHKRDLNEVGVMDYLKKGLAAYNSYLKRNLNLQIKNLQDLVYRISVADQKEKNLKIKEISIAFNKDDEKTMENFDEIFLPGDQPKLERETLTPLRKLYEYSQPLKPDEFLASQSFLERIKDKTVFLATIPPLVISVIDMYTKIKSV